jgi:hypothetical protein
VRVTLSTMQDLRMACCSKLGTASGLQFLVENAGRSDATELDTETLTMFIQKADEQSKLGAPLAVRAPTMRNLQQSAVHDLARQQADAWHSNACVQGPSVFSTKRHDAKHPYLRAQVLAYAGLAAWVLMTQTFLIVLMQCNDQQTR